MPIPITEEMLWASGAVFVFMLLDFISGVVAAFVNKAYDSKKVREELFHKGGLTLVVVCALAIDVFIMHIPSLGIGVPLLVPVCVIIVLMEVTSITENAAEINPGLKDSKLLKLFKVSDDMEGDKDERN